MICSLELIKKMRFENKDVHNEWNILKITKPPPSAVWRWDVNQMEKKYFEKLFWSAFLWLIFATFGFDSQPWRVVNLDWIMIIRRQRQGFVVKSNLRNPVFTTCRDTKTTAQWAQHNMMMNSDIFFSTLVQNTSVRLVAVINRKCFVLKALSKL